MGSLNLLHSIQVPSAHAIRGSALGTNAPQHWGCAEPAAPPCLLDAAELGPPAQLEQD